MISFEKRKDALVKTGVVLRNVVNKNVSKYAGHEVFHEAEKLSVLIEEAHLYNRWFNHEMVQNVISEIGNSLEMKKLDQWLAPYAEFFHEPINQKTIAVIMAGNIPAVGFHDFLSVLISGHKLMAKLSSEDDRLIPAIADILIAVEPGFGELIHFENGKLADFDAVVATGSNNTARYFDFYFGKYPHIIRKNRNGVGVLDGNESREDLEGLTKDIFLYFGLGCRNVSKIYVPNDYHFQSLLETIEQQKQVIENSKYFNNYEYNKAIFLINQTAHFDTSNLLLVENKQLASPVSVLHYEFYDSIEQLKNILEVNEANIQCVVSGNDKLGNAIPFGQSQQPQLWDYADGVDTMQFLLTLN